ncbi:MAG: hypothetical protein VYC17_00840 [Nitrospinota bacterium]|nr:hypothetical protein [Nitrospinota bacterium]
MLWRVTLGAGFVLLFLCASAFADGSHPTSKLGKIKFSTSGSEQLQPYFLRGVAALHSFWYEEALKSFRKGTQLDPDFIMGYWGEAMAHNHVLWEEQNTEAAREVLAKIKDVTKVSDRERAYVDAAGVLYGDGDKQLRDRAYATAMKKIYRDYPEDLEAACFYALSLLGVGRNSEDKLRLQIQAGEIALDVFRKNSDHPCAAHYAIHAFDHPDLAVRALPAALRYAQIAPDSHHAQHMPAHIFVQLGMWPEATAANEAAWRHSVNWVDREGLSMGRRDYHSLQWLHYVYLQQGRYQEADQVFHLKLKDLIETAEKGHSPDAKTDRRVAKYLERMIAASVFEKGRWDWVATFKEPPAWKPKSYARAVLSFVRGFSAARQGQEDSARYLDDLKTIRQKRFSKNYFNRPEQLSVWELEIQGEIQVSNNNFAEAITLAKKAIAIEEKLSAPSGPPRILKPAYEWLGEIFLRADRPKEAAQQFTLSLLRHPNRARSFLGAARAAARPGDRQGAIQRYSQFLVLWEHADKGLPELREARNYLEQK